MGSTANVLTGLGTDRLVYKQIGDDVGIVVGPRTTPRVILPGMRGYKLGLYDRQFVNQTLTISGATTYFVRIVPEFSGYLDVAGDYLTGIPTTQNTTKGVIFIFAPVVVEYPCTGYQVWAGTVTGTLYYQGTLSGRFSTKFVIGTTWAYSTSGSALSAKTDVVPQFVDSMELYQSEGSVSMRTFLGGGKTYQEGYAKVAKASSAPVLTCGTAGSGDYTFWNQVANGSFKMRVDNRVHSFTGLDLSSAGNMAGVATIIQTKINSPVSPVIYGGNEAVTDVATWALITNGSFRIISDGVSSDIVDCDFTGVTTMLAVAGVLQTKFQASLGAGTIRWDTVKDRFIVSVTTVDGSDQVVDGNMSNPASWTAGAGWEITGGAAVLTTPTSNLITNGTFATDSNWAKGSGWTISGGRATFYKLYSTLSKLTQSGITNFRNKTVQISFRYNIDRTTAGDQQVAYCYLGRAGAETHKLIWSQTYNLTINWTTVTLKVSLDDLVDYNTFTFAASNSLNNSTSTFRFKVDDVSMFEVSESSLYQQKAAGNWNSGSWVIGYAVSGISSGKKVRSEIRASDGTLGYYGSWRYTDGTFTDTLATGSDKTYNRIYLTSESGGDIPFSVDNVTMFNAPTSNKSLSDVQIHSTFIGTDVSSMMSCRELSPGVNLNYQGKSATTETVVWSTDHFIITGPSAGSDYRLSYLETADGDIGTDISSTPYLNGTDEGNSVYSFGKTVRRSVEGNGTSWGGWATGMRLRFRPESSKHLIQQCRSENEIVLDSDYTGDSVKNWERYVLEPYDSQVYVSELSDPFTFLSANILALPTVDSDRITAIKRVGLSIAVFMEHHVWMLSSVDITAPRLVSNQVGVPNDACIIEMDNGLAFYSGEDFMVLSGGRVRPLDANGNMRELLSRVSSKTPYPHGVYYADSRGDVLKWWFGLDDSPVYNVAICMDAKRNVFWLENQKDAQCSCVIRDSFDNAHIITGSTYDDAHSIPAFTMIHGTKYKSDAASGVSIATRHGTVSIVGSNTETAGYLTCGVAGLLAAFQAVTSGYFRVEIDGEVLDVGPIDFSGAADEAGVASTIQTAIRAITDGLLTVAYSTDRYVITSGTTTNASNVGYLEPYIPAFTDTDLSAVAYLNGREGKATQTMAVSTSFLTLIAATGAPAVLSTSENGEVELSTSGDGEKGCFVFVCDTDLKNGQFARVVSNTADTLTVTPVFATAPVAGWYWYMGGIVPSWTKWMDFGSPQHKQKLHGIAVSVAPGEDAPMNLLGIHQMQDLVSTVRTAEVQQLGGTADTVNTVHMKDKEATQHGIRVFRPGSLHGLKIEDITVTHAPRV